MKPALRLLLAGRRLNINNIGTPGNFGFGVGVCPALPAGFSELPGTRDKASEQYGNYRYSDGSIMVWVPAFWFRLGHASNPTYATYGVNSIDVQPIWAFADDATANAAGYWRHRAFINAGANQLGFFRDKYHCSNQAGVATSVAGAMPLVSAAATGNSPFSGLTGAPTNAYHGAIAACKTRGARFFPESVFIVDALARLTEAHAQASSSTNACAWYHAVNNFPKGNNSGALADANDATVTFTSAGASGTPLLAFTGSASNVAKTTHNGQACGIADVNGNAWTINLGLTCIATSKAISAATQANPVALTVTGHGRTTGDTIMVTGVAGMTQINDRMFTCTVVDADTITLDGTNGTGFNAYTSGGTVWKGDFYTLKTSVDIAAVTSGTTLATDHWGATGVAAQFDLITPAWATTYSTNTAAQRYGNGGNAVFDMTTANGRALAMAGLPAAGGMSQSGTNMMGQDYYYQYVRDQLCAVSRGSWDTGVGAGVRARALTTARADASTSGGVAAACYL